MVKNNFFAQEKMRAKARLEQVRDKYCTHCGRQFKPSKFKLHGYNPKDGSPNYFYEAKCPRKSWWNLFSEHDDDYTFLDWTPSELGVVFL